MRTPEDAIAWARATTADWSGLCMMFCRTAYALASKYGTAALGWYHTTKRGSGTPPFGALVWWTGGSDGAGHVALSVGGGYCLSSDFGVDRYYGDGEIRRIPISAVAAHSSCVYRGWSRDINDVVVLKEEENVRHQEFLEKMVDEYFKASSSDSPTVLAVLLQKITALEKKVAQLSTGSVPASGSHTHTVTGTAK